MKLRMLLNGEFSGPQAFFFLAKERGWLAEEGIDLTLIPGAGAATAVARTFQESFDLCYGDINALIETVALHGEEAPLAVWATYNTCPFTIAVRADGPIKTPADFEGRAIFGSPTDAALKMFPALALNNRVDPSKVTILSSRDGMRAGVEQMFTQKTHDGVFGFVNTIIAAIATSTRVSSADLRFINYADWVGDLYANAVIVSRKLAKDHPEIVTGLVRAFNRGLVATLEDVDASLMAVLREAPNMNVPVQKTRLLGTLNAEMRNPEGARIGIGDVDDERLARSIALIALSAGLPAIPSVRDVFDRSFLPPLSARVTSLVRPGSGEEFQRIS
jgi:NitT/TauT family transport system substrate-binding protein